MDHLSKYPFFVWDAYYSKIFRFPMWLFHKLIYRNINPQKVYEVKMRMGHKMLISPQQNFLKNVIYSRQYNDDNTHLLHHFVKHNSVVLDIGANVGLYSCAYAQLYKDLNLKIYAIEALENNFKLLKKNIELNHFENISAHQVAIGKTSGFLDITVPNKDFVGNAAGDNIQGTSISGYKYQVKMVTLDNWTTEQKITQCDYIKIDIEGAEYFAFLGGSNFIKKTRPVIQSEFNRYWCEQVNVNLEMIAKFFTELDYVLAIEEKNKFRFLSVEELTRFNEGLCDLLFVPKEKMLALTE